MTVKTLKEKLNSIDDNVIVALVPENGTTINAIELYEDDLYYNNIIKCLFININQELINKSITLINTEIE